MNVEEPLPCPFCGNEVKSQSFWWHGCAPGNGPRGYYVFCLECSETDALDGPRRDTFEDAIAAWNRRTPPAMSADHIGEAQGWRDIATAPRQEPVLVGHSGFLGWRRLAICNALGEWSYCDRPWLQQDPLDETPTHWHPLPPPPSAHPAPIKPSGDTGELRERVARIVDPAGFDDRWDVPGLRHEASLDERVDEALAKADAILDLIQSERAG